LGYLLWWLQEHQSKVLVVMTTNDEKKIPPELYRAGRVDEAVEFTGILQTQVLQFIMELALHLTKLAVISKAECKALAEELSPDSGERFTQARITEAVLRLVKMRVIHKGA